MRNARLDEAQAGIKIGRRNINSLRYRDDTTLLAETEEELKSLLMKVKEESEKAGLKLNIQKAKIMAFGRVTSWQRDGGTMDWFKTGKGLCQGSISSPSLFNLYPEYIMQNAGLVETQGGIKIAGRNINDPRYADDTTVMAESEEELKSLLMKVKEESF